MSEQELEKLKKNLQNNNLYNSTISELIEIINTLLKRIEILEMELSN